MMNKYIYIHCFVRNELKLIDLRFKEFKCIEELVVGIESWEIEIFN